MGFDGHFTTGEMFMDFDSCSGHGGTNSEVLRDENRL